MTPKENQGRLEAPPFSIAFYHRNVMNLVFSLLELVVHESTHERTHEDQGPPEDPPYLREDEPGKCQAEPDADVHVRTHF